MGSMGKRHARVLSATEGVELVWTADPVAAGVSGVPHFVSAREAAAKGADVVVVATPTRTHAEVAQELLEADISVLVEKPLAHTVEHARRLADLARERSVLLAVGHVERFNPAVAAVENLLRAGSVGEPLALVFRRVGLPPAFPPDVDVLLDLAVHDLDVCALLLGRPLGLVGGVVYPTEGPAESAQLLLRAEAVGVTMQVNWRTPTRIRQFSVTAEECLVEADYTRQTVELVSRVDARWFDRFAPFQEHYGSTQRTGIDVRPAEPLALQAEALVEAVRTGTLGRLAGPMEALAAIELAVGASRGCLPSAAA